MALNASQTKPKINIRAENALEEKAPTLRQERSAYMNIQQCLLSIFCNKPYPLCHLPERRKKPSLDTYKQNT